MTEQQTTVPQRQHRLGFYSRIALLVLQLAAVLLFHVEGSRFFYQGF